MNQWVAIARRVCVALAVLGTAVLLSGLISAASFAQGEPKPAPPATPAPADPAGEAAKPAEGRKAKHTKPPKQAKVPRASKARKSETAAKPAKEAKPAREKVAKAARVRAPEKSLEEMKKEDGVYAKGSNWLSLRFGYAKRTGDLAGDGFIGYGVGYQHVISRKYAFAADVGHDIVGHLGNALDEAVPFTGEFRRTFNWKTAAHPFVGLGGGYYRRKAYRTGTEYTSTSTGGPHVTLGFTAPLDNGRAIGIEVRAASLRGRPGIVNPAFGPGQESETVWTAKVTWALVY